MYILKISKEAFIKTFDNKEVIINADCNKAQQFERIGDAMKAASIINTKLENAIVYVINL